ncbi:hypothetical protein, conserved [Plasmodium gonderi]|uniref:Uncharacterized protein n=1 Tax=Plasmodium gonderi TaxID=77519 RepID=A0A1Y1JJ16_PLAGO|nr:hypothetical protein, conserved [Plasmodium gonderi]GAW82230.1 hypothetical protein, conserved [Plasmodium gonderi]
MPIGFNCLTEEGQQALEDGKGGSVIHKDNEIEFIYNKLNLGMGKLYILEKKLIWVSNESEQEKEKKKKKITDFKEITTNPSYLKHYEKHHNFYMHLLNNVSNISVDSSDIALHAITSDKKICSNSCVYIQLNSDITGEGENEMNSIGDEREVGMVQEEESKYSVMNNGIGEDPCKGVNNTRDENSSKSSPEKLGKRLLTKLVKKRNFVKKNNQNVDNESDHELNGEDMSYEEIITPEIILISKNHSNNEIIFRQLSNMENSEDEEDDDSDGVEGEEEEEEEEEGEEEEEEEEEGEEKEGEMG